MIVRFQPRRYAAAASVLALCLLATLVAAQADPSTNTGDDTNGGVTAGAGATADNGATQQDGKSEGGLTNVTSIVGTWSSGSQAVETGINFFNPVTQQFTLPKTAGISYSFTDDGHFETSKYRFESNPRKNRCFKASLVWQHGEYTLHPNGSLTLQPYGPDGYIQVLDPCAAQTSQIYNYNEWELIPTWYNYLDGKPGFAPDQPSAYGMQLFAFDGQKMPMMWLKYRPPNMLPTQQLFMKVLNGR